MKIVMCCLLLSALCGTARAGENWCLNPNFELQDADTENLTPRQICAG